MAHTDNKLLSYFRLTVWWLGQQLPMDGVVGTSFLAAILMLVAWGVVPLYLWKLDHDPDFAGVLQALLLSHKRWMVICWAITGIFTFLSGLLVCRLLVLQYKQFYDKYNIPGIRL